MPVASYQLVRFAGSCSQVRNCAAAFLFGDQEVMKIAPGEEFRLAANYRIEGDFSHVLKSVQPLSVSQ